jgi:glycosyltransferase involved in cell wall biosynthesis
VNKPHLKQNVRELRVAIVHDWFVGGGAEQVVEAIHQMFPKAPIYTAYCSPQWQKRLQPAQVITSYMQRWPLSKLRRFLPALRQRWFSKLDLSEFDLVISSSGNGEAKGVRVRPEALHVCYCHSPTHFYWRHYRQYLAHPGFGIFNPLARFGLRTFVGPLRKWDYRAAHQPDYLIANSKHIKSDIGTYYDRDAVVIHPPINIDRFKLNKGPRSGFVTVGRQVPYKRTDLLIKACNRLGLPLTVVGRGPEHHKLVKLGGSTITFIKDADDQEVAQQMAQAEAFLFGAFEDFGVTPVEAMASGTPVIAYQAGGALDYVTPDKTGLFFEQQTVGALIKVLQSFPQKHFKPETIRKAAEAYSTEHFKQQLERCLEHAWQLKLQINKSR